MLRPSACGPVPAWGPTPAPWGATPVSSPLPQKGQEPAMCGPLRKRYERRLLSTPGRPAGHPASQHSACTRAPHVSPHVPTGRGPGPPHTTVQSQEGCAGTERLQLILSRNEDGIHAQHKVRPCCLPEQAEWDTGHSPARRGRDPQPSPTPEPPQGPSLFLLKGPAGSSQAASLTLPFPAGALETRLHTDQARTAHLRVPCVTAGPEPQHGDSAAPQLPDASRPALGQPRGTSGPVA